MFRIAARDRVARARRRSRRRKPWIGGDRRLPPLGRRQAEASRRSAGAASPILVRIAGRLSMNATAALMTATIAAADDDERDDGRERDR